MKTPPLLSHVGGYVLAGGRSSRMGADKALIELAGKSLIAHAVTKLSRICGDVHILTGNPNLATYAPNVPDIHPGCGPIGGLEAALAHSTHDWNLILPVDLPFVPTSYLQHWANSSHNTLPGESRLAFLTVYGIPQPTLLMIHRDVAPYLTAAIARSEFKLFPVLQAASLDLAAKLALPPGRVLQTSLITDRFSFSPPAVSPDQHRDPWHSLTPAQQAAKSLWFTNLNTPQEFAEAQAHIDALDT